MLLWIAILPRLEVQLTASWTCWCLVVRSMFRSEPCQVLIGLVRALVYLTVVLYTGLCAHVCLYCPSPGVVDAVEQRVWMGWPCVSFSGHVRWLLQLQSWVDCTSVHVELTGVFKWHVVISFLPAHRGKGNHSMLRVLTWILERQPEGLWSCVRACLLGIWSWFGDRPNAQDFNRPQGFLLGPQLIWFPAAHGSWNWHMVNMHAVRKTKTCYLRTALFACLMLHPGCISLWGPDCRSWSIASRATSMRNALNSFGVGWDFVIQGNLMASRRGLVTDGCFTSLFKICWSQAWLAQAGPLPSLHSGCPWLLRGRAAEDCWCTWISAALEYVRAWVQAVDPLRILQVEMVSGDSLLCSLIFIVGFGQKKAFWVDVQLRFGRWIGGWWHMDRQRQKDRLLEVTGHLWINLTLANWPEVCRRNRHSFKQPDSWRHCSLNACMRAVFFSTMPCCACRIAVGSCMNIDHEVKRAKLGLETRIWNELSFLDARNWSRTKLRNLLCVDQTFFLQVLSEKIRVSFDWCVDGFTGDTPKFFKESFCLGMCVCVHASKPCFQMIAFPCFTPIAGWRSELTLTSLTARCSMPCPWQMHGMMRRCWKYGITCGTTQRLECQIHGMRPWWNLTVSSEKPCDRSLGRKSCLGLKTRFDFAILWSQGVARNGREIARNGRENARNGREKKCVPLYPWIYTFFFATVSLVFASSAPALILHAGMSVCVRTFCAQEHVNGFTSGRC